MNINEILRKYEAIEANLEKLFSLWIKINKLMPEKAVFFDPAENEYDDYCRSFSDILEQLPKIDGYKLSYNLFELNEIGKRRLEIMQYGEIEDKIYLDEELYQQEKDLFQYKFLLNRKRKELIRKYIKGIFDEIDIDLLVLLKKYPFEFEDKAETIRDDVFTKLKENISILNLLLGSIKRPIRWSYIIRHLNFGMVQDLHDIQKNDWPEIKKSLENTIYAEFDPIVVDVADINELIEGSETEKIIAKLKWENLNPEDFERIIYNVISDSNDYENPQWLMKTNAADQGRDLSVDRVYKDHLSGVIRNRVVIQCKHWLSKSISDKEIIITKEQIKLWEPPKVDVVIIATSGRFSASAVRFAEKNNSENNVKIEMWADSHLETLLSERPALVAEYNLR